MRTIVALFMLSISIIGPSAFAECGSGTNVGCIVGKTNHDPAQPFVSAEQTTSPDVLTECIGWSYGLGRCPLNPISQKDVAENLKLVKTEPLGWWSVEHMRFTYRTKWQFIPEDEAGSKLRTAVQELLTELERRYPTAKDVNTSSTAAARQ